MDEVTIQNLKRFSLGSQTFISLAGLVLAVIAGYDLSQTPIHHNYTDTLFILNLVVGILILLVGIASLIALLLSMHPFLTLNFSLLFLLILCALGLSIQSLNVTKEDLLTSIHGNDVSMNSRNNIYSIYHGLQEDDVINFGLSAIKNENGHHQTNWIMSLEVFPSNEDEQLNYLLDTVGGMGRLGITLSLFNILALFPMYLLVVNWPSSFLVERQLLMEHERIQRQREQRRTSPRRSGRTGVRLGQSKSQEETEED